MYFMKKKKNKVICTHNNSHYWWLHLVNEVNVRYARVSLCFSTYCKSAVVSDKRV